MNESKLAILTETDYKIRIGVIKEQFAKRLVEYFRERYFRDGKSLGSANHSESEIKGIMSFNNNLSNLEILQEIHKKFPNGQIDNDKFFLDGQRKDISNHFDIDFIEYPKGYKLFITTAFYDYFSRMQ